MCADNGTVGSEKHIPYLSCYNDDLLVMAAFVQNNFDTILDSVLPTGYSLSLGETLTLLICTD